MFQSAIRTKCSIGNWPSFILTRLLISLQGTTRPNAERFLFVPLLKERATNVLLQARLYPTVSYGNHKLEFGTKPGNKTDFSENRLQNPPANAVAWANLQHLSYCERLPFDPIVHAEWSGYMHRQ